MAIIDIVMPKMGESIMEATILKWCKSVGDNVKMDETLLEIATDKVDSEVPSTGEGVLKEILFKVDDVVPVGTVIAKIDTASGAVAASPAPAAAPAPAPTPAPATPAPQAAAPAAAPAANTGSKANANFFSPLVLNIAAQENVSMAELQNINGTGAEGRITKKDILIPNQIGPGIKYK
jgi:2-oxoglutarate dehydrogenase E2 component (dihydrolipoamide succinyltransferase)